MAIWMNLTNPKSSQKLFNMAKISVIIPVYNRETLLRPCLESLEKQTFHDFELVFVDDCSSDKSRLVLQDFLNKNKKIQGSIYSTPKNSGVSAARNVGIANSTGEYIYFIDSDDSLSENCLEKLYNLAYQKDLDIVIGENLIIGDTTKYVKSGINEEIVYGNSEILRLFTSGKWYNVVWNKLVKRAIVTENQLFFKEGYIFEDELWTFSLATKVNSLGVIHDATYFYKIGHVSIMTSNQKIKRWSRLLDILPLMKEYILKEKLETNPYVSFFYLEKLAELTNAFFTERAMNYTLFKRIKSLSYIDMKLLLRNKHLSKGQYWGWLYFSLPNPLAYLYCTFLYRLIFRA